MTRTIAIGIQDFGKIRNGNCFYVDKKKCAPYWVNTSSNGLLNKIMKQGSAELKMKMEERYMIRSNRESGFGRYDVMMIPKDKFKGKTVLIG
jgi:hypothetical protein